MTAIFDDCARRYCDEVQSSVDFSGPRPDVFVEAMADVLVRTLRDHLGAATLSSALHIGCGT